MVRRARKRIGNLLTGFIMIPAVLLTLPATIAIAKIARFCKTFRTRGDARRLRCPGCGHVVGRRGVHLADKAADRFQTELNRWHPETRFTLIRTLFAICPRCDIRFEKAVAAQALTPQEKDAQPYVICSYFLQGQC